MTQIRYPRLIAASLAALFLLAPAKAQSARGNDRIGDQPPALVNTCLITKDVKALVKFYASILKQDAQMTGDDYAEFHTGVGVLAIFSAEAQERYIPGSATPASNKSVILEFRVADVDVEYRRLQDIVKVWVKPPCNATLGNSFHLLPRSGWKSSRFLFSTEFEVAPNSGLTMDFASQPDFVDSLARCTRT